MASGTPIVAPAQGTGEQGEPRRWLTLIILLLAAFMNLLDITIVTIAVPSIQRGLNASYADAQWALAGYTLAYGLVLITGGRLGDIFGRKRLILIGVAGFTVMSALCGAASGPGELIGYRVVQGATGAIMVPQVLALIQVIFPPRDRIKALAAFGMTAGLGAVSGPLFGGLLIQHDPLGLSWRSIFLINVPVGLVALPAVMVLVRESKAVNPPKLDVTGVALISVALVLLLYPLVQGRQLGWPAWSFAMMACSVPLLAAFVGWVRIKNRRDGSPLVQPGLFRDRGFSAGMAVTVTFFLGIASFALVLTLFLQLGLGFTALHAGLTFLSFSIGVLVSSAAAAQLAPRFGRAVIMTGAVIIAAGMASVIGIVHHFGAAVTTWNLAGGLVAVGLGCGAVIAPLADIVLAGVPERETGSASGVFDTGLQLGNSIGIAVIGVIFFGLLGTQSGSVVSAVSPQLRAGLTAAGVPARYDSPIITQFRGCLHDRLVATDPTVTPAACQVSGAPLAAASPAVHRVLARAASSATSQDFASALQRTLWFQVGVFCLSLLLMLGLPGGARQPQARPDSRLAAIALSPPGDESQQGGSTDVGM